MKPRLYIETSVVSYLTARPTRDLIRAAHQQLSMHWWDVRRRDFDIYVSELVIQEAGAGDDTAAQRRLDVLQGIPLLQVNEPVIALAEALTKDGPLPKSAADDAFHLALAAVHAMDYLLTWNCRHLANAELTQAMNAVIRSHQCGPPHVCTPEELMGDWT